jgi:hypothetical protein
MLIELTEAVVTTFLEASITGAGLVLAIYALITPISKKLFSERADQLNTFLCEFEEGKKKLTDSSSNKDYDDLKSLLNKIKNVRTFPMYMGIGIIVTFTLFVVSAILDWMWLISDTYWYFVFEGAINLLFIASMVSFLVMGLAVTTEISDIMKKDYEEIKKKQKEAKEYKLNSNP